MKNLVYKEFKLATHPTGYLFLSFGLMLLIPAYPYYVAFVYMCLAVYFIFLTGRENKDTLYTAMLPVKKTDTVKARCLMVAILEIAQIVLSIPFAMIGIKINPNMAGNTVGIEANVAFYGLVLVMFALFNYLYIPSAYKNVQKPGKSFIAAFILMFVYIFIVEAMLYISPALKAALDTSAPAAMLKQIPVLIAGIAIFMVLTYLAYKRGAHNFEKADL